MSFIQRVLLKAKSPVYETKRFRGKINIQRPRVIHYRRQVVMDVCRPFYERIDKTQVDECTLGQKYAGWLPVDNPFEHILAKECLNWFNHSQMIIFYHLNPVIMEDKMRLYSDLKMENMTLRTYGKKIVGLAVAGTNYEAVNSLFTSHTNILFSERVQVQKLLKMMRKLPQLIMIAGIVDGKLLSRNEIMEYSELPSIDILRSQLCNTLQSVGSNLVNQMNQHQTSLVSNLDQYVKLQNTSNEAPAELPQENDKNEQIPDVLTEPKE